MLVGLVWSHELSNLTDLLENLRQEGQFESLIGNLSYLYEWDFTRVIRFHPALRPVQLETWNAIEVEIVRHFGNYRPVGGNRSSSGLIEYFWLVEKNKTEFCAQDNSARICEKPGLAGADFCMLHNAILAHFFFGYFEQTQLADFILIQETIKSFDLFYHCNFGFHRLQISLACLNKANTYSPLDLVNFRMQPSVD